MDEGVSKRVDYETRREAPEIKGFDVSGLMYQIKSQ